MIFLHDEQLSQRFADDGLNRTATVALRRHRRGGRLDLVVETAEGDEPPAEADEEAASEEAEEAEGEEGDGASEEGESSEGDEG